MDHKENFLSLKRVLNFDPNERCTKNNHFIGGFEPTTFQSLLISPPLELIFFTSSGFASVDGGLKAAEVDAVGDI